MHQLLQDQYFCERCKRKNDCEKRMVFKDGMHVASSSYRTSESRTGRSCRRFCASTSSASGSIMPTAGRLPTLLACPSKMSLWRAEHTKPTALRFNGSKNSRVVTFPVARRLEHVQSSTSIGRNLRLRPWTWHPSWRKCRPSADLIAIVHRTWHDF